MDFDKLIEPGHPSYPPQEVIDAAEKVGRWFAQNNIDGWQLGPCADRNMVRATPPSPSTARDVSEPTAHMVKEGVKALLGCTESELGDYGIKLMENYEDEVRRVYVAMSAALAANPAAREVGLVGKSEDLADSHSNLVGKVDVEAERKLFEEWLVQHGMGAGISRDGDSYYSREIHNLWTCWLAAASSSKSAASEVTYGPVHVVGDLVRNLLTLDQSAPIYSAFHVDFQGERRCRTRPVSVSWERVIDGKWIDPSRKDVPYAVIVWAKQDEPAAREVDVEAEWKLFLADYRNRHPELEQFPVPDDTLMANPIVKDVFEGWLAARRTQAEGVKKDAAIARLARRLVMAYPKSICGLHCAGEPIGEMLVDAIAATQSTNHA